ncbi:PIN domain-containing protein [Streptomyces lycii]|uniref:PIN domain-containing protein n=1 Tax=Streptomyces lycii TaxID=2654337 RepID=A0ABQ7FNA6_9ACTN|nr:PIN domain-containing protein [Streptomyces lycii]KAF4410118.1 PIN domain-containing protein [Streptomyces lycii]
MTAPSAFLDTCVLYPGYLRDTLLSLSEHSLYRPLWSGGVLVELERNLVAAGMSDRLTGRLISRMQSAFEDAEVTGYEPLTDSMTCDPKDRHVLAAAVHGRADSLITFNLRDFPQESLSPHDIALQDPDDFLLDLLDLAPGAVMSVLEAQAGRYKRDPKTLPGLLNALAKAGVPDFAEQARRHLP